MSEPCKIAVVGSLNVDYFVRVRDFPEPGETVNSSELEIRFGGKGANQAVAAARLGAQVEMIGCVGGDQMGRQYLQRLRDLGIGVAGVDRLSESPTGSAFITLDLQGENTIVVAPGANGEATPARLGERLAAVGEADVLLIQNEVPEELNLAAIELARAGGTKIVYNPAPWRDGFPFGDAGVDVLVVNELEAANLLGCEVSGAGQLRDGMVVTRGEKSTLARFGGERIELQPEPVVAVDTVGAGDTFCGALATFLGEGGDLVGGIRFANRAAGLATLATGAQEAMPDRQLVG